MTQMQKIVLLLTLYFSNEDGRADLWREFTGDRPLIEDEVLHAMRTIINGVDGNWLKWPVLDDFIARQ